MIFKPPLDRELAKHAVSEGTKAVTKFASDDKKEKDNGEAISALAGLQLNVVAVVAIVSKTLPGVLLSVFSAVYLAAVAEYMLAELLELSGNAARDKRLRNISPRCLLIAVKNDEEINAFCRKIAFREGGLLPHINDKVLQCGRLESETECDDAEKSDENVEHKSFGEFFSQSLRSLPEHNKVLIDPRDGCHKCPQLVWDETSDESENCLELPCPEYDAACEQSRVDRQELAIGLLSEAQHASLAADGFDFEKMIFDYSSHEFSSGDKCDVQSIDSQKMIIRNIGIAEKEVEFGIDRAAFRLLVMEVGQDYKTDLMYTEEAFAVLQCAIEANLIKMFECANLCAMNAGRSVMETRDFDLAIRILNNAL